MGWRKDRKKKQRPPREWSVRRHWRHAREIRQDPRRVGPMLRGFLLEMWRARGGGFYGLGYIVVFLTLELRMFVDDLLGAEGVVDFIGAQLFEHLLLFGLMSLVNVVQALIWPVFVLNWLGEWGLVALFGGYLLFERVLRQRVEAHFPELRPAPESDSESA